MAKGEWRTTTALIDRAREILDRENPMTVRQLLYRLVGIGFLKSTGHSFYSKVVRDILKAREDGRIPWEWIVDRSRPEYTPSMFDDVEQFAEVVKNAYRKNYWAMQPNHVELWSEKDAIYGSVQSVTDDLGVTVRVGRGYNSATKRHEIEVLFRQISRTKRIYVLYLGDFDPSGMSIEKVLTEKINANFSFRRLAIHKADIKRFNLPPLLTKESDSRTPGFIEKHGKDCVELDALPPVELRRRIREAVEALMDKDRWALAINMEKAELNSILSSMEAWKNLPTMPDGTSATAGKKRKRKAPNS